MENKKRLSILRVILAIFILSTLLYSAFLYLPRFGAATVVAGKPWFAPYVDVTATPRFPLEQLGDSPNQKNLILSFVVSSTNDACTPSWGGVYTLDEASTKLDLDRRIARFRQRGGNIAVSFGGLLNDELAVKCIDQEQLLNAYRAVIDRYSIDTLDFDIEGKALSDMESLKRRSEAVATLQNELRSKGKSLAVWLTLPVAPQGLTQDGTNAISQMLESGVDVSGINVMTMDYGASLGSGQTMLQGSIDALNQTHRQLGIIFNQAGINLNANSIWKKIGATPMIGQNDTQDQIFTLEDAKGLNEFAITRGIVRMSMWSANRDIACGENYVNVTIVSDSCSGVKQEKFKFTQMLGESFNGDISSNAAQITVADPKTAQLPDDPQNSPYQIWTDTATYLEGTKVVWHHNVYQAKWWTQGDLPDNPVLQSWETPWQLIGPVLAGEKPLPQPTLSPGTYPEWSGTTIYNAGERVLFSGVPYQAKWWTQGDSPAASTSSPDSSPWKMLTQLQIDEIIKRI